MNTDELVIDESNFNEYFFDAKKYSPKQGQVLACYETMAELVDSDLKKNIVQILQSSEQGATSVVSILQKHANAPYDDALKLTKEILLDLQKMSVEQVLAKPYEFRCQIFYYTEKQYIPCNDRHWWSTSLIEVKMPENFELTEDLSENITIEEEKE